jgi:hypothetical protein
MSISRRTLGIIAEAIHGRFSHARMNLLVFQYGLDGQDPGGSVLRRAVAFVKGLENTREERELQQAVLEIATTHLDLNPSINSIHVRLIESLRIDGFEFTGDRFVPSIPGQISLSREISRLETELENAGLATALVHYRQAVDNFLGRNWEAANGQIRPFVENLVIQRGLAITGNDRNDPNASLQDMRHVGYIDDAEFNQMKAFWAGIQDNGPHHGLSNDEEALFRLHTATTLARYLLCKAP